MESDIRFSDQRKKLIAPKLRRTSSFCFDFVLTMKSSFFVSVSMLQVLEVETGGVGGWGLGVGGGWGGGCHWLFVYKPQLLEICYHHSQWESNIIFNVPSHSLTFSILEVVLQISLHLE